MKRISIGLLGVFIFLIFYFAIPIEYFIKHEILLTFIASVSIAICVFISLTGEFIAKKTESNIKILLLKTLGSTILLIALAAVFLSKGVNQKNQILDKSGIQTVGMVVDKTKIGIKRNTIYKVKVEYMGVDNETFRVDLDVLPNEYLSIKKGQKIDIVYSKNDPEIVNLIVSEKSIKKYKKTEERNMQASDLIAMLEYECTELENYLNTVSYGWNWNEENRDYLNSRRKTLLTCDSNYIKFISYTLMETGIEDELMGMGFVKDSISNLKSEFVLDSLKFTLEMKIQDGKVFSITKLNRI